MKKRGARPRHPEEAAKCRHYLIIESPNGPTSCGVCQYCGAELEFINYFPTAWLREDSSASDEPSDSISFKSDE